MSRMSCLNPQREVVSESEAIALAQQQAQRAQQDEVATQPATTPRALDPPVQEWPVVGVQQPPPSPRAQRLD